MLASSTMRYLSSQPKPFHVVRKPILRLPNNFLAETKKHHVQSENRLDSLKGITGDRLAGFLTENEILGMLGAKDYDNIYFVLPFLGEIVEVRFNNTSDASVTDAFTKYVHLLRSIKK